MDSAQKVENGLNAVGLLIVLCGSIYFILMAIGVAPVPGKSLFSPAASRIYAGIVGAAVLCLTIWGLKHFAKRIKQDWSE